jgi:hypothetical protein
MVDSRERYPFKAPNQGFFAGNGRISGYFLSMLLAEKIVLIVCLLGGFLWLRKRTRNLDLSGSKARTVLGIFVLLPLLLILEKQWLEQLNFHPWVNIAIKAAVLIANFPLIGLVFVRPGGKDGPEEAGS